MRPINTDSIDCRKVEFGKMEQPGDFTFDEDHKTIYIWLPGIPGPDALAIQKNREGPERVWNWNGDENMPTLSPSIHCPGLWHGYLKKGN